MFDHIIIPAGPESSPSHGYPLFHKTVVRETCPWESGLIALNRMRHVALRRISWCYVMQNVRAGINVGAGGFMPTSYSRNYFNGIREPHWGELAIAYQGDKMASVVVKDRVFNNSQVIILNDTFYSPECPEKVARFAEKNGKTVIMVKTQSCLTPPSETYEDVSILTGVEVATGPHFVSCISAPKAMVTNTSDLLRFVERHDTGTPLTIMS